LTGGGVRRDDMREIEFRGKRKDTGEWCWEIIHHERISVKDDESNLPVYFVCVYVLRCKKCGLIKLRRVKF
jgi:hypothetical protein